MREFWAWETDCGVFSIYDQIQNESSIIGQPFSLYPEISKYYVYITDIDSKSYHPKIKVHIIKTGEEKVLKVSQNLYHDYHFKVGDILLCKTFQKKFRKTKDENGKWVETENFDFFLTSWYKMKPEDDFKKD